MNLTLKDLEKLKSVEIVNTQYVKGKKLSGVSTDSRTIKAGNLFFALRGEKFDGHQFVPDVAARGVFAVVVDEQWSKNNPDLKGRLQSCAVIVPDTTKALGELAALYRMKFSIPIIAVGGSNGKTTTKEMISAVLKTKYSVLSTEGNLNNQIGVPQMVFRLTPKDDIAVLELGTNHFGELKHLCTIVEPTHALITNIGKEHLEFFGDEEGVSKEETELFRSVQTKGFAFINIDDEHLLKAGKKVTRTMTYGSGTMGEVRATNVRVTDLGQPIFDLVQRKKKKKSTIHLSVTGMHNISNALAAAAVGIKFNVPEKKILHALHGWTAAKKRMEIISRNGITILNDTYNANPDSTLAALKTLQSIKVAGKKFVVLADMLELGEKAEHEHAKIGLAVSDLEFEYLLTFGPLSRFTHEASKLAFAEHFDSKGALIASLKSQLSAGDAVLVKGSRSMEMEDVVAQL
jgi:UDP-N-acetylmuramoyl-tripeptide--D-alanyl-D-alanine ligase